MQPNMARTLKLPANMPTNRFRPAPPVKVPGAVEELPLLDGKTPPDKQVQQVWITHARVFDLTKDQEVQDYNAVWQKVTDGWALRCLEKIEFHQDSGAFLALLRWVEFDYKVPEQ